MAISSINFQKSKSHSVAETTREFQANYLLPKKYQKNNEYWNYKNSSEIKKIDLDFFNEELSKANRKGGKIPKFENSSWEAVLNLNENHNIDDVKKVLEHIEKKFNIKGTRIAIHKDEGNYNPVTNIVKYNYHAHLNFVTYKDGKQNWRLAFVNKDKLRDLQTEVAEILEMERGEFNSKSVRANHRVLRDNYEEIIEDREAKKEALEYKNKNIDNVIKGKEIIYKEKAKSKKLDELLKEKEIKKLMQDLGGFTRVDYVEIEALKKELINAKASEEDIQESYRSLQAKYELKKKEVTELTSELHFIKCNEDELTKELEEIKLDVYSPDFNSNGVPVKNIDVVKYLQDENKKIEESLKNVEALKMDIERANANMQEELEHLRNQNKSLQDTNRVLEYKVTVLQEKIVPTQNMSDYEQIKKENVELKKENSILSRMFNNAVDLINSQIERLLGTGKEGRNKKYTEEEARAMAEYQIENNVTFVVKTLEIEETEGQQNNLRER